MHEAGLYVTVFYILLEYFLRFTALTSLIPLINQLLPLPRILFSILSLNTLHRIAVWAVEFHGLGVEDIGSALRSRGACI